MTISLTVFFRMHALEVISKKFFIKMKTVTCENRLVALQFNHTKDTIGKLCNKTQLYCAFEKNNIFIP